MKKAACSVFIIMLLLYTAIPASAVEPLVLNVEGYTVKDNAINVYCNTNLPSPPTSDKFTVSIGNSSLEVKEVKKFSDAGQGKSIIFLADVSGSISTSKLQSIKDTLNAIVDGMSPLDNASVLTVGNEGYTQDFISDKEQLKKQIADIKRKSENTNLYSSIVKALDILSTNEKCAAKKCIIILSDGEDYGIKGITREEVNKKIEERPIPIYTIAMLGTKPAEKCVETSKILGSFARLSPGGIDYIHELNSDSSSKIAEGIKSSIDTSLILAADLSGLKPDGNEMYMNVELSVSGQGKTNDGYSIATAGFPTLAPSNTPTVSPTNTPTVTPTGDPAKPPVEPEKEQSSIFIWLAIGLSVIILSAAVIIILGKRKKSNAPQEIETETETHGEPAAATEVDINPTISEPQIESKKIPDITIRLTKVGLTEEQVYHSEISSELVIGRDPSKSGLTFSKDDLLSSRHCSIRYDSGSLILQDLGSTNGTYVNGVPITGPYKLENDDIILIGSMELRINW